LVIRETKVVKGHKVRLVIHLKVQLGLQVLPVLLVTKDLLLLQGRRELKDQRVIRVSKEDKEVHQKDLKDHRAIHQLVIRVIREVKGLKEVLVTQHKDLLVLQDLQDLVEIKDLLLLQVQRDLRVPRHLQDHRELKDPRAQKVLRVLRVTHL
jgi:hypothetical protein